MRKMRKKNGFTLVELLAVIVVLAIIMVIAIPAVLEAMNNARRQSFILYVDKVVKDVQTNYVSDSQTSIPGTGIFVYDITTDLGYTSTGSYHGYVVVDAAQNGDVDTPHYIVFLYDNNYMVSGWDITATSRHPSSDDIDTFDYSKAEPIMGSAAKACKSWAGSRQCMNRKNFIITENS